MLENYTTVSDYRNPIVAEAMKILGYVNRFNRGIMRVEQELAENNNGKAQFDISKLTMFSVLISISTDFEQLVSIENNDSEQKSVININKGTNKNIVNLTKDLPPLILDYCITPKKLSDILKYLNYSDRTKFRNKYITSLLDEGLLEMTYPDNVNHRNQSYFTTEKGKLRTNNYNK